MVRLAVRRASVRPRGAAGHRCISRRRRSAPLDSEPCVCSNSCSKSSIRWASLAIRFRPMDAADPLILWAVPIRPFRSSPLPPFSSAKQGAGQRIQGGLALVDEDRKVLLRISRLRRAPPPLDRRGGEWGAGSRERGAGGEETREQRDGNVALPASAVSPLCVSPLPAARSLLCSPSAAMALSASACDDCFRSTPARLQQPADGVDARRCNRPARSQDPSSGRSGPSVDRVP